VDEFTYKTVDSSNWNDFEKLFNTKKILTNCWCMAWRMTKEEQKNNTSADRKKFIKARIDGKVQIGLLAYDGKEPIAWCSIAPRESYSPALGGDDTIEKVWSIACFYIKNEYRDKGLLDELIKQAIKLAKIHKANYLEATPVKHDSPSYKHMGNIDTFKKAGFEFVKMEGTRRQVMTKKL
jgi:hypothetical protein